MRYRPMMGVELDWAAMLYGEWQSLNAVAAIISKARGRRVCGKLCESAEVNYLRCSASPACTSWAVGSHA